MKFKIQIGFTIFLLIAFAYAIFEAATKFSHGAEIFPLILGIPGLSLCVIQLALEIYARSKGKEEKAEGILDVTIDSSIPYKVAFRGAARMLIWILGLYLAIWIVGFKIAVIAYFILYLRREGHAKWQTILLLTGIAVYAIFFHFERVLSIHWPNSLLSSCFDIHWLLG